MLSALSTLTAPLAITFLYGERGVFSFKMDKVEQFPVLYMEGYGEGDLSVNANNDVPINYQPVLWLFGRQKFDADPTVRSGQIESLLQTSRKIVKQLARTHTITGGRWVAATNVPATDRPVDGIRFTFTATPKVQTPVNSC